jgi:uncharacterized protein (TIGR02328 family)
MRLWHEDLIPLLPRQQLLGQHRECCALRGGGWGKPHATVNYAFKYGRDRLYAYHTLVMAEMQRRGYRVSSEWLRPEYRGKVTAADGDMRVGNVVGRVYPEHDVDYLRECIDNLRGKGAM